MKRLIAMVAVFFALTGPACAEELTVSAAASLTDAFGQVKLAFEAAHPGASLVYNFGSSGALYKQIEQGAPADVFASANQKYMDQAEKAGFLASGTRKDFASNDLVLAVPAANPAKVTSVEDLKAERVARVAVGNPDSVPAGQYAKKALTAAGLYEELSPKYIFGENVRQVLDYLSRGEVDAGFVYATDARKGGDAVRVAAVVPLDESVSYPVAVLKESAHRDLAEKFVAFLTSSEGLAILERYGFGKP